MASEIEKGTKYIPEMSKSEIDDLNKSMKTSSLKVIEDNIEKMKKAWKNRPKAMEYFDEISNLFGKRQEEIKKQKAAGKKVIGYSCIFAPIEMILAADAIPVRVGSGWYDSAKLGDRIMPVEVCPVIRSTVGAQMVNLSPFLELSDAIVMPLTCDGRTKLSEMLADHKPIWRMNPPRVKDDPHTLSMWKQEIMVIKEKIEKLTGNKIDRKNLKAAIEGERYEYQEMYPEFVAGAEGEGNQGALATFKNALAVEEIHHGFYTEALNALKAGGDIPVTRIHICPVCGNTVKGDAPDKCSICGVPGSKFIEAE